MTTARNAAEAIEMLTSVHPLVPVSDLGMSDMDGLAFIRAVRTLGHGAKELPAVA